MNEQEKQKYLSEEFVTVPVYRGYREIENLFTLCKHNDAVILGGYVRWMCSPNNNPAKPSDIDIYCGTNEIFEAMKKGFVEYELEVKNQNDISVSYVRTEFPHSLFTCPIIQLVKPLREGVIVTNGDTQTILKNFDFTVVRIGLVDAGNAIADPDFLTDEQSHRLRIKNIHCPISSMYRVMKYRAKGYWPSTGLLLKLFLDWEERPDETKLKILAFYKKLEEDEKSVTAEEIDEMEKLMRLID